jgi:hypothetical protein
VTQRSISRCCGSASSPPAELDEIRELLLRATVCLEPTRNAEGHLIIDVVERGVLVARLHHDGSLRPVVGHPTAA